MLKIKELRQNCNLTQSELAKKINSTNKSIWSYENDVAVPPLDVLLKLADFFECSIDYLVGRSDDFGNVTVKKNDGALTPEEQTLIDVFRKLNLKNRMHVSAYAEIRLEQQESGSKFA